MAKKRTYKISWHWTCDSALHDGRDWRDYHPCPAGSRRKLKSKDSATKAMKAHAQKTGHRVHCWHERELNK